MPKDKEKQRGGIYDPRERELMVEEDLLSGEEEGFMRGYENGEGD
jgi:hypothetical protein